MDLCSQPPYYKISPNQSCVVFFFFLSVMGLQMTVKDREYTHYSCSACFLSYLVSCDVPWLVFVLLRCFFKKEKTWVHPPKQEIKSFSFARCSMFILSLWGLQLATTSHRTTWVALHCILRPAFLKINLSEIIRLVHYI